MPKTKYPSLYITTKPKKHKTLSTYKIPTKTLHDIQDPKKPTFDSYITIFGYTTENYNNVINSISDILYNINNKRKYETTTQSNNTQSNTYTTSQNSNTQNITFTDTLDINMNDIALNNLKIRNSGKNWMCVEIDDDMQAETLLKMNKMNVNGEIIGVYRNVEDVKKVSKERGMFTRIFEYFFGA